MPQIFSDQIDPGITDLPTSSFKQDLSKIVSNTNPSSLENATIKLVPATCEYKSSSSGMIIFLKASFFCLASFNS